MRRLRLKNLSSRITLTALGICLGTVLVIYVYVVVIGGAASGLGSVKAEIVIGGLVAAAITTLLGLYYTQTTASNVRRLQDAARKVADGNFETTIPVAAAGQLAPLARTFNEMQRRLAELDSARKAFIANASHELRTPIFSLGGFVELLEEEDPSPEERDEFVRTMREQIERLTKLTVDLLDLSQMDAGAMVMHSRSVDLSALAREVTREFGAARRSARIAPGAAHARAAGDRDRRPRPRRGRSSVSCSTTPSNTRPREPR